MLHVIKLTKTPEKATVAWRSGQHPPGCENSRTARPFCPVMEAETAASSYASRLKREIRRVQVHSQTPCSDKKCLLATAADSLTKQGLASEKDACAFPYGPRPGQLREIPEPGH